MYFQNIGLFFLASQPVQCYNIDSINTVSLGRDCLFGWSMADWAVLVKPVWKQSLFMHFYLMLVGLVGLLNRFLQTFCIFGINKLWLFK